MPGGNNCTKCINKINHWFRNTQIKHPVSETVHEKINYGAPAVRLYPTRTSSYMLVNLQWFVVFFDAKRKANKYKSKGTAMI